jgi:FtsP/CotA-like multicopper oxidase with cupredoxin domain
MRGRKKMNNHQKLVQKTMDLQRQITEAKLSRRDMLKMGLISASTGMLLPISGLSLRAAQAKGGSNISSSAVSSSLTSVTGGSVGGCPVPGTDIISPVTRPWIVELPRLVEQQTVTGNDPKNITYGPGGGAPGPKPVGGFNTVTQKWEGDCKHRLCIEFPAMEAQMPYKDLEHQAWGKGGVLGNHTPKKWYEMHVRQFNHVWHPDMPAGLTGQAAWGFESVVPGPMFRTRYGESHFTRIHNHLPEQNLGFGINQITTHMHNLHTPSESDGNPLFTNYSGQYYDYHYPNVYAGVNQYNGLSSTKPVIKDYIGRTDIGNPDEALGTLWYHDHKLDFTSQNVYAGLAGMNSIYDAMDAYKNSGPWKSNPNAMGDLGDERLGWGLPCGDADSSDPYKKYEFDVGLVFHDRQFDPTGADFFPLTCFDGAIGDKMTVNGKIQPKMTVKRRKYRFRFLDMGPSRVYNWFLSNGAPFIVIANDGNLFPAPIAVKNFQQAVAERFDVILDFSSYKPGTEIILLNRAEQTNGRGPTNNLLTPGYETLKFVVSGDAVVDNSRIPATMRALPDIDQPISNSRTWKFERGGGEWLVNGSPFNRDVVSAEIPEGNAEHWQIINGGGSWLHPVHIHYEEHRYLKYNGTTPEPLARGRKDVIRLDPNATVDIYMRFRDYKGLYPMHCHNVVHEDHAMMVMWKIA